MGLKNTRMTPLIECQRSVTICAFIHSDTPPALDRRNGKTVGPIALCMRSVLCATKNVQIKSYLIVVLRTFTIYTPSIQLRCILLIKLNQSAVQLVHCQFVLFVMCTTATSLESIEICGIYTSDSEGPSLTGNFNNFCAISTI